METPNIKILEVHQIYDEILQNDFSEFDVFTFDDGLYSQYKNVQYFLRYNKPLYFFISPFYIRDKDDKPVDFMYSDEAQKIALKNNDRRAFMSLYEIKELQAIKNVHIGGHSYSHKYYEQNSLKDMRESLDDFNTMMDYFNTNKIHIDSFCYPYNNYIFTFHNKCEKLKLKEFSQGRIPVESALGIKSKNDVWINRNKF